MKNKYIILIAFLFFTQTSEAQWFLQNSGVSSPLYDIEMINNNIGWTCGENGIILKTTDGGMNWEQQITNVPNKPLFGIHPVNENVVYSVGWFGTILKTTNGGDNWLALENGVVGDGNYFCVFFINEMTGWIGENNNMGQGDVKKTTDGGLTFVSSYTFGWPNDLFFKDSLNGIGVYGAATIHRTTNGGINWESFSIAGAGDFYRVSFIDVYTGFTVADGTNKVYKTTNFGISWNEIATVKDVAEGLYSITFSSDSVGWIGGNFSRLYKSTNGGFNWKRENITTGYILNIASFNDSILWICGPGGAIWHTSNGGEPLVGIQNVSSEIPTTFNLKQNYPNPFNSQTNIEFDIKIKDKYKLEIINPLGQIVDVLINREIDVGSYQFIYNSNQISTGFYYYRLSSHKYIQTKKFILLK